MRALALVALIVLAGCQAPDDSPEPPVEPGDGPDDVTKPSPNPEPPADPAPGWESKPEWQFVDCWFRGFAVRMVKPMLEPYLPPGYSLVSGYGDGVSVIPGIIQFDCEALVVGNTTVISPVHWAATTVAAEPAEKPENATGVAGYQFEWFIDNASAAQALRARGFNAFHATIDAQQGDELDMSISVEGEAWYVIKGYLGENSAPQATWSESHFHGPDFLFANMEIQSSAGGLPGYTTTLDAHNGLFAEIAPKHVGTVASGEMQLTVTFERDAVAET